MKIIRKFFAYLRLREAIKLADKAYLENNHRYFVIPSAGVSGNLVVLDRATFRGLKQEGYIDSTLSVRDLLHESFYYTPNANGKDALPLYGIKAKQESYYNFIEAVHKAKKARKKMK